MKLGSSLVVVCVVTMSARHPWWWCDDTTLGNSGKACDWPSSPPACPPDTGQSNLINEGFTKQRHACHIGTKFMSDASVKKNICLWTVAHPFNFNTFISILCTQKQIKYNNFKVHQFGNRTGNKWIRMLLSSSWLADWLTDWCPSHLVQILIPPTPLHTHQKAMRQKWILVAISITVSPMNQQT